MARAKFPDGSTPEPVDVARIAANLFSAGRRPPPAAEHGPAADLRRARAAAAAAGAPRADPRFIEETLRRESPIKGAFRLALKTTTVGGVEIPAGSNVMLLHGATGRDPRQFECPHQLDIDRANVRQHISFGAGIDTCPGAPLAGPRDVSSSSACSTGRTRFGCPSPRTARPTPARRGLPTYMIHGLRELNLEFDRWNGRISTAATARQAARLALPFSSCLAETLALTCHRMRS